MPTKDMAQLIEDLFQTRRNAHGEIYTNQEIANWITDNIPNAEISTSYLSKMRLGESRNPSRDVLMYLCIAFKTPPSYFFPELMHLEAAEKLDNSTMLRTALQGYGLDEETQRNIESLIRKLRNAQRGAKTQPAKSSE